MMQPRPSRRQAPFAEEEPQPFVDTLTPLLSSTAYDMSGTHDIPLKELPSGQHPQEPGGQPHAQHPPAHRSSTMPSLHGGTEDDGLKSTKFKAFKHRLQGKHLERRPTFLESFRALATSSWLNLLLVFVPLSWVAHFLNWNEALVFAFSFVAIIPLEKNFDYGGEQMAHYCGKSLGDLLVITLANIVEVTLAILLLVRCEIRLMQATIIGVVILQMLLVSGTSFLSGGARIESQDLHLVPTQLNLSLLTIGVLALLVPTALFSAIDNGEPLFMDDGKRSTFLKISRGIACILLLVYVCSRIYLHNPPGDDNALTLEDMVDPYSSRRSHSRSQSRTDPSYGAANGRTKEKGADGRMELPKSQQSASQMNQNLSMQQRRGTYASDDRQAQSPGAETPDDGYDPKSHSHVVHDEAPELHPLFCALMLAVTIAIMAATAEWLVHSLTFVKEKGGISEEFFGMVLLPLVSFSGDAIVTSVYYLRKLAKYRDQAPEAIASHRPIDLSVQFTLFWLPLLVLASWFIEARQGGTFADTHPLGFLFDLFEVSVLLGATFLLNYVTGDAKTNWAEGMVMIAFYFMIALTSWFYNGQPQIARFVTCAALSTVGRAEGGLIGDVAEGVSHEPTLGEGTASAVASATTAVGGEILRRLMS